MDDSKALSKTQNLFFQAKKVLVGGVNSPVRAFNYVGGSPLLIKMGRGSKVYDHDGKEYIDYVMSWGSLILGHAYPKVITDLRKTVASGLSFGTTNAQEIRLAELIQQAIPFAKKIRFTSSGTEAVMGAIRLARAYTGQDKIIKFTKSYHGHADYLLVSAGSGLATLGLPLSDGVPKDFIKHTLVAPFGDKAALHKIFQRYSHQIAAVLVEPVGGNYGVLPADKDFLKYLRVITKKHGSLLIADEIITGFRFHFGSFISTLGIKPDLICLGKIIGGGLPIGAYAGSARIMNRLAPLGNVYQASTFSGNPVVMQAGITTLEVLAKAKGGYQRIVDLTRRLTDALEKEARARNIKLKVTRFASIFSLRFAKKDEFRRFYQGMIKQGVYLAPSEFEANFLSLAHSQKDLKKTITSVRKVLTKISS